MQLRNQWHTLVLAGLLGASQLELPADAAATVWQVSTGGTAADTNPGTKERPVQTVKKAVSLVKPGDTVVFSAGSYPCSRLRLADGTPDSPITLRSEGKGRVIFTSDSSALTLGSHTTVDGIEFECSAERPGGPRSACPRRST